MHPSLYLQIIHTTWTKQSRGGPLATPRNAVPLAFSLEDLNDGYLSIQHISYSEHDSFQSPHIIQKKIELTNDFHYEHGSFTLSWDGQVAKTGFRWSWWSGGAPRPKTFDSRMGRLDIAPDEWSQLRWRGRFSDHDTGLWSYEHTCINVAHFTLPLNPHIFLQTQPTKYFTHLPHLW